jgi:maltooligosyltrehalose synthase
LAGHVVAFARTRPEGAPGLVTLAPRLPGGVMAAGGGVLGDAWAGTTVALPGPGPWTDVLTGQEHEGTRLALPAAFATLPVALLVP